MIVSVVNVREVGAYTGKCVYVGRAMRGLAGHPLGNPFKIARTATDAEKIECLKRYEAWMENHPQRDKLLHDLADFIEQKNLPVLGCWCGNWPQNPILLCHAVVIARKVQPILEARHATDS